MFKIGEFSKLSQVPVKTLRYYDEIDLLKPAKVDDFTGYRYYSAEQLFQLNRILALKDLGLSLAQIGELLDGELPAEQIRGMLRMQQAEVRGKVKEEQARLARVEWRLKQIEQEGAMSTQEVVLKKVPAMLIASVRDVISTYGDISQLYSEVFKYTGRRRARPAGPALSIYYDEGYREQDIDVAAAVPVSKELPSGDRVKVRELAAVEEMACIVHKGSYDTMGEAYNKLLAWIEANGYRICGPNREVYIKGPGLLTKPSKYVTELQIPVEKE
ncbi:MAG: MerR family transcriptional regulator [Anaerolineae bacterium]